MISYEEALENILKRVRLLGTERVSLENSINRCTANPLLAVAPNPPFDNSQMDGYALRAIDTEKASNNVLVKLKLKRPIYAGELNQQSLNENEAVKITTGAPMPLGADAVAPFEDIEFNDEYLIIRRPIIKGDFVRYEDEDHKIGDVLAQTGDIIQSGLLTALASNGEYFPVVYKKPNIALFTTGNEIVEDHRTPKWGQIPNANAWLLKAQIYQANCNLKSFKHINDDLSTITKTLKESASRADLIITCGGVSVGEKDYILKAVEQIGRVHIWKAAIKPGKPFLCGEIDNTLIFGLPGNPASAFVTFEIFVRPALMKMGGFANLNRLRIDAICNQLLKAPKNRDEFFRVILSEKDDKLYASVDSGQDSHLQESIRKAEGLMRLKAGESIKPGDKVKVMLLS